jgi:hypothetical protein
LFWRSEKNCCSGREHKCSTNRVKYGFEPEEYLMIKMKKPSILILYAVLGLLSGFFFVLPFAIYELNIMVNLLTNIFLVSIAAVSTITAIILMSNQKTNSY